MCLFRWDIYVYIICVYVRRWLLPLLFVYTHTYKASLYYLSPSHPMYYSPRQCTNSKPQQWGDAYDEQLLEQLRHTMSSALLELSRAFPNGHALNRADCWIPTAALLEFARCVVHLGGGPGGPPGPPTRVMTTTSGGGGHTMTPGGGGGGEKGGEGSVQSGVWGVHSVQSLAMSHAWSAVQGQHSKKLLHVTRYAGCGGDLCVL